MKLAVIGAGVVGVTTAYALALEGHEVTVLERCSTAAEGASFANAGLIAPEWLSVLELEMRTNGQKSTGTPWLGFLHRKSAPVTAPDPGPALCALSRYGAETLSSLCDQLQLEPDSHQGLMVVWKHAKDDIKAESLLSRTRGLGGEGQQMSAAQARELELALNPDIALQGALVMPGIWSVNCRQFTLLLRAKAQQIGCRFEFNTPVTAITVRQGGGVELAGGLSSDGLFDAVVLCAGATSTSLLQSAGTSLPLEPWTGHSLSTTLRQPLDAPVAVVHDLRSRVTLSRMGQRIRVSGPLTQAGRQPSKAAFQHLYEAIDTWFPGAIRHGQSIGVQEWHASVDSTPDALPVVGQTQVRGVWVNAAHGNQGWTMACGCATLLADQIAGRRTAIDAGPYDPTRWAQNR